MSETEVRPRSDYEVLAAKMASPLPSYSNLVLIPKKKYAYIRQLVRDALDTDGVDHKQWFLWQIGKALGITISDTDTDEGIPP